MAERPILFSDTMVRAILAGAKTQTRRLVKPQDCVEEPTESHPQPFLHNPRALHPCDYSCGGLAPYAEPGDRLWVREAWCPRSNGALLMEKAQRPFFRATDGDGDMPKPHGWPWRPSIHMPRWACRLVLEVTEVRVERLNDITEDDVRAEGLVRADGVWKAGDLVFYTHTARQAFWELWDSINGERAPWESNPWVWVVSFRRTA